MQISIHHTQIHSTNMQTNISQYVNNKQKNLLSSQRVPMRGSSSQCRPLGPSSATTCLLSTALYCCSRHCRPTPLAESRKERTSSAVATTLPLWLDLGGRGMEGRREGNAMPPSAMAIAASLPRPARSQIDKEGRGGPRHYHLMLGPLLPSSLSGWILEEEGG